jgi:hypothetical protein
MTFEQWEQQEPRPRSFVIFEAQRKTERIYRRFYSFAMWCMNARSIATDTWPYNVTEGAD